MSETKPHEDHSHGYSALSMPCRAWRRQKCTHEIAGPGSRHQKGEAPAPGLVQVPGSRHQKLQALLAGSGHPTAHNVHAPPPPCRSRRARWLIQPPLIFLPRRTCRLNWPMLCPTSIQRAEPLQVSCFRRSDSSTHPAALNPHIDGKRHKNGSSSSMFRAPTRTLRRPHTDRALGPPLCLPQLEIWLGSEQLPACAITFWQVGARGEHALAIAR